MRELELAEIEEISGGFGHMILSASLGLASYGLSNAMMGAGWTLSGAVTATVGGGVSGGLNVIGGAAVTGAGAVARTINAVAKGTLSGAAAGGAARTWEDDS